MTDPFSEFAGKPGHQSALRDKITAAYRRPETECLPPLLEAAAVREARQEEIRALARKVVTAIRERGTGGGIEGLMHEYALSSDEGVALMCLAEALLRTPDKETRDALIRDKIARGDWRAHLGGDRSVFVNAATWGLAITGRLVSPVNVKSMSGALTRLLARGGEPIIRAGVDMAMRIMGEQFVCGQTIEEALRNGRKQEARGFRYSYDMLGEAAMTAADADRYMKDYVTAIEAIGKSANGRGIYDGAGISIKLSALHPRYCRAQYQRVMSELLPRVKELALLARQYDLGLNIDAEEADRLELSLDILEALCRDRDLAGWDGIGFVVQAYSKRCPFVLDYLIDLARRSSHRLMVRLVKGAYWDSEIKRAQLDGQDDFPVYTRKVHTDVSYLACARKLLAATDVVYPQFATHNAHTMAWIYKMAGDYWKGQYEFQCLHGMGEPLYDQVVGKNKLDRPCRIYAPVGSHETLLAYLVRRLLENGANSSFVNQIANKSISIDSLVEDPVAIARQYDPPGLPHPQIALPAHILGPGRKNSEGLDLSNEHRLQVLQAELTATAKEVWRAEPLLGEGEAEGERWFLRNPADRRDIVGEVIDASEADIDSAMKIATAAANDWAATAPSDRAKPLLRAADLLEERMSVFMGLAMREAGKSAVNAIGEVREAVDFLRYYARRVIDHFDNATHLANGPVVCISPWNFPLAIFTGQISAALAAGNPVLAKPAEETPLIAAAAVRLMHEAGVPRQVLQLLPGDGRVGAALIAHEATCGVLFTGSTAVARLIQAELAKRLLPDGRPIPLIAETGGQNAMIVDSSALPEQVVADVITSAFDSAGQRCSALRLLCLQDDIADRTLSMIKGAMQELSLGNSDRLSTDVGPVITEDAQRTINAYIADMAARGFATAQLSLPVSNRDGTFVAPTIIELNDVADLGPEVFGPVLHVVRFKRGNLDGLIADINAMGYGLTFGIHSRIDETIGQAISRISVGNIYVNRNIIGAVVGVQPFGGHGLSGTGPKAGGPLYLRRLVKTVGIALPDLIESDQAGTAPKTAAATYCNWLRGKGFDAEAERCANYARQSATCLILELPGPVGERNTYALRAKGCFLLKPQTFQGLALQLGAVVATGNRALIDPASGLADSLADLPPEIKERIVDSAAATTIVGVLQEGTGDAVIRTAGALAETDGPIILLQAVSSAALAGGAEGYSLDLMVDEVATSVNTAAAGGNASLMSIG